jgi:glycerol-3-phosphate dehydrogenase
MTRDIDRLTSRTFDLLVVGGGICGLMAAWDAATRGLHVALIERHDFGSGASFHHHRTLHGGLRYLQSADLVRLRESVRERRTFARIAPHFISVQPFAIAAGDGHGKSPALLRAGFAADALLSADRNRGVPPDLRLPAGRLVGAEERQPSATGDLLPDGTLAVWHDYRIVHAERLTLAVAMAAAEAGAVLANHLEAIEPVRDGRRVIGVNARDAVDQQRIMVRARVTLNATGAAAGRLMAAFGVRQPPLLVKAMNVITRHRAPPIACGAPAASGRLLFALPWQGRLSIGTWHPPEPCGADASLVTSDELAAFFSAIHEAFPRLQLSLDDVTLVQRGVVPARWVDGRAELADRPLLREHRHDGIDGAISMVGVKYTTARAVAEQAITLVMAQLGKHAPSRTSRLPLPGSVPDGSPSPMPWLDVEAWQHLQVIYGADALRVARHSLSDPGLAARVLPDMPIVGAQIVEAVHSEMALTLEDVMLRRTGLGSAAYAGDAAVLAVERLLRPQLGWASSRMEDEVRLLKEFYLPVHV